VCLYREKEEEVKYLFPIRTLIQSDRLVLIVGGKKAQKCTKGAYYHGERNLLEHEIAGIPLKKRNQGGSGTVAAQKNKGNHKGSSSDLRTSVPAGVHCEAKKTSGGTARKDLQGASPGKKEKLYGAG